MSSRKGSASKSSASKMNSSIRPGSSTKIAFNSTLRQPFPMPRATAGIMPIYNWGQECSFVYNEYLQSLVIQELTERGIRAHSAIINDQLSLKADFLADKQKEVNRLEEEIEKFELKPRLQELSHVVETSLSNTLEVLSPEVVKKLDNLLLILEEARNKLYLKNFKPFQTDEEIDKFVQLLNYCLGTMKKIIKVCPNIAMCKEQVDVLNAFNQLQEVLLHWEESIFQLQSDTSSFTLEILSDVLFNVQENLGD